jgi:hypothetical protein
MVFYARCPSTFHLKVAATDGRCFKDKFCSQQPRCDNGRLYDCSFYDADAWVCMSEKSNRRYDWIEYEDGTILGLKGHCTSETYSFGNVTITHFACSSS